MRVDALKQNHALELNKILCAHHRHLGRESIVSGFINLIENILVGHGTGGLYLTLQRYLNLPLIGQHFFQRGNIPLLFNGLHRHVLSHQIGKAAFAQ